MAEQGKTSSGSDKKPSKVKKPSVFARIGKWFRELKSETKKIVWPNKEQVKNNTAVVLLTILIVGVFIWILDFVFNNGVSALLGLFS